MCIRDRRSTKEVDGVMTAVDTLTYNENEIRRIAIKAFDIAMKRRKKVISVDKANAGSYTHLDGYKRQGKVRPYGKYHQLTDRRRDPGGLRASHDKCTGK